MTSSLAPASSKSVDMPRCPNATAKCSGVYPSPSVAWSTASVSLPGRRVQQEPREIHVPSDRGQVQRGDLIVDPSARALLQGAHAAEPGGPVSRDVRGAAEREEKAQQREVRLGVPLRLRASPRTRPDEAAGRIPTAAAGRRPRARGRASGRTRPARGPLGSGLPRGDGLSLRTPCGHVRRDSAERDGPVNQDCPDAPA